MGRLHAHNQRPFPLSRSLSSSADSSTHKTSFLKNAASALLISHVKKPPCAPCALLTPWYSLLGSTNKHRPHFTGRKTSDSTMLLLWAWLCMHFHRETFRWTVVADPAFLERWLGQEYETGVKINNYGCNKALFLSFSEGICSGQSSFTGH